VTYSPQGKAELPVNEPKSQQSPVIPPEVRVALYHRLHFLWPVLARPAVARGIRLLGWGLFGAWLCS
jgi:hypothetical protein